MTSLIEERATPNEPGDEAPARAASVIERMLSSTVGAVCVLMAIYIGVVGLSDLEGNIGSDVGGKTATVDALVANGSLDLGYWAEEHDPDGSVHPMFSTAPFGDDWVNVTTLPMILLAWPLAEVGGLALAMVLPMMGSVAAALAARRLATQLGGNGVLAVWAVGLGSPAAFYASSFWEHSLGLGLMAWAVAMLYSAFDGEMKYALASGALFGAAATLRQEALVYGFVAGLILVAVLSDGWARAEERMLRERSMSALLSGASMAFGAVAMLAANTALEQAVLGESFRGGRAASSASSFATGLGRRWNDAVLTTFAPFGSVSLIETVLGLVLIAAIGYATLQLHRGADARRPLVVAGVLYLLVAIEIVVNGLSFIPSLLIVAPLAIVGAVLGSLERRSRPLVALAVGALPLVWMVQYSAGMAAQWGGRYLLLSGWLLIVLACGLHSAAVKQIVTATAAVGFAMAALGAVWTVQRTNVVGSSSRALALVETDVVVFNSSLDARQTGSISVNGQWLAADNSDELDEVLGVLEAASVDQFAYIDVDFGSDPIDVVGFIIVDDQRIDYLAGFQYRVTFFERIGS